MITGSFKDGEWRTKIRQLEGVLEGKSLSDIVADEARLFLRDLLKILPPKTQAQGRKAVSRDLTRAVELLQPKDFESPRIQKLIRSRNYPGVRGVFRWIKERRGYAVEPFDWQSQHARQRDSRGRINRRKRIATLDARQWRAYRKRLWSTVGIFKAPFAFALASLGGGAPGWLRRHFPAVRGSFRNNLQAQNGPSVQLRGHFFNSRRLETFTESTMRIRLNKMGRRIDYLLKNRWR